MPALDGLRAIAVFGVMLFHGGAPGVGGGFLGVNVFFVLSGFLITSLLLGEWATRLPSASASSGPAAARRLLPALLVLFVGVAIYAKVFASPGQFPNLRLDTLSSLFYVANWHFIFAGTSYFDQTVTPSPLAHMWSLAIEEQFYIVWPPVVLVLLRLGAKLRPSRRLWPVLGVAIAGALGSACGCDTSSCTAPRSPASTRAPTPAVRTSWWVRSSRPRWPCGRGRGLRCPRTRRPARPRRRGPSLKPIAAWEIALSG